MAALLGPNGVERHLMPTVIDQVARDNPDRPWASVPYDDNDLTKGYEDISYAVLANAINKLAWVIDANVPKSNTVDVVAYLGAPDLRYHIIEMAACKTGRAMLFSSHLNSLSVHLTLMEQLDCKALLYSTGVEIEDILEGRPMISALIPELEDVLNLNDRAEIYPFTKTYQEGANIPFMYIHTSGTTGIPKPVAVSHDFLYTYSQQQTLPDVEGRSHIFDFALPGKGVRDMMPVPPYHGISALCGMQLSVLGGGVFLSPYRHRNMTTTDPVHDVLYYSRAENAYLVPHIMEAVAKQPNPEKYIKNFKSVSFGGGELSEFARAIWSKYTRIQNCWGSTEAGFPPQLRGDPEDHAYIYWDMEHSGIEFREMNLEDYTDGANSAKVYEMVFKWNPKDMPYSAFWNRQVLKVSGPPYPDHHVGDLWTPHPDPKKAHYVWRYVGRIDDVVILSTGVNVNTGNIEKALTAHELVKAALVIGNKRLQPLALVEFTAGAGPEAAKEVFESVLAPLNARMQAQARIASTHVLVVPEMGLVRTVKGTVSKVKSERKFEKEIEEIYAKYGDKYQDKGRP